MASRGRKIKTPHLDRMADNGTRFSSCITPNLVWSACPRLDPDRTLAPSAMAFTTIT